MVTWQPLFEGWLMLSTGQISIHLYLILLKNNPLKCLMIIANPLYSHRINSVMSDQESVQNTDLHKQTEKKHIRTHIGD